MCGISGYVTRTPAERGFDLNRMTGVLRRRGPDDEGCFVSPGIGLGMRRLSIIDIEGSQQPTWSCDGRYVSVFNGEIYNYLTLREDLAAAGVMFKSRGDSEVFLNQFARAGVNGFRQVRGMFGVAIWDTVARRLTVARDPLGIKPIFYRQIGTSLLFGSEIKSILAGTGEPLTVNLQAVDALLTYNYIPAPLTIWSEIHKLPAGHVLSWQDGRITIERYWDLLDFATGPQPLDRDIRDSIDATVRTHMSADVPVGAFLSGGIDSSTIVACMQAATRTPIQSFCINFESHGSHILDESPYARELQALYKFELHEERVAPQASIALEAGLAAFDEPFADDSLIPSYYVCQAAARHLKVALSGIGGDELFGGYNRYQGLALAATLSILPRWINLHLGSRLLKVVARALGPHTRPGDLVTRFSASLGLPLLEAYLAYITATPMPLRRRLYQPGLHARVDFEGTRELVASYWHRASHLDPIKRAMYVDANTYLPEDVLALADRVGMWHSLEVRVPLADRCLAERLFCLPAADLVTATAKKIALKRAVRSWLPVSILSHQKQGFEAPTAAWIRGPLREYVLGQLQDPPELVRDIFAADSIREVVQAHLNGQADNAKTIFALLTVMVWARQSSSNQ